MTQPTPVVGLTSGNDNEFTSPLASYALHSARRCVRYSLLLR